VDDLDQLDFFKNSFLLLLSCLGCGKFQCTGAIAALYAGKFLLQKAAASRVSDVEFLFV